LYFNACVSRTAHSEMQQITENSALLLPSQHYPFHRPFKTNIKQRA